MLKFAGEIENVHVKSGSELGKVELMKFNLMEQ